jgi:hypothetical protein
MLIIQATSYSIPNQLFNRWPGTNLFFNAKVSFVRDDDNEYDVTFEDGTVFTLKAKDVKKEVKPRDQCYKTLCVRY